MATTGIWKIQKRLDHVLDYIMNLDKTNKDPDSEIYQELHNFKNKKDFDLSSEEQCYISTLNCSSHRTYKDMMLTKKIYNKNDGILAFHAYQSFKPGEVSADTAHLIGIKLAEEMWGDRFEVVVTTHITSKCIHNHFVINSVSFVDGKKYSDNRESYARLRSLSDSLCEEYGLSVIEEKKLKSGINYSNYYKGYVSKSNYHTLARQDLDRAIAMAYSYKDFENLMKKMNYEVINRYGKLSIRREPYKKNIRIERSFGADYSISSIEERIQKEIATRVPFIEAYIPMYKRTRTFEKSKKQKSKGLYGLYKYYCYILKVYPRHYPRKILSPELRVEVQKMDSISLQTKLLVSNQIKTYEELLFYKNNLISDVDSLVARRNYLWNKVRASKTELEKNNIRIEIDKITKEVNKKREEVVLCEGIEKRSGFIEKNVIEFEKENDKEGLIK